MWNWIKENSDWLCSVTFGRFPPFVRFFLGICYEIFDYALRVIALLIPGSGLALDGPYLFVAVLLAGAEGIRWGLGDVLVGFIPFGDWFPGLSVACFRVWRGCAPDPGGYDNGYEERQRGDIEMEEKRVGTVSKKRPGCLSPHFFGALTFVLLIPTVYFGYNWIWSYSYDYHEKAWEIVQKSPTAYVAAGKDKAIEIKDRASAKLGPMIERGKQAVRDIFGQLGFGQEEESLSGPSPRQEESKQQKQAEAQKKEGKELNPKLKDKAEKELKLGPYMTELYAGRVTREKAEELRKADIAYYKSWLKWVGIPDLLSLIITVVLAFFGRGGGGPRRYGAKDTIGLDDDDF